MYLVSSYARISRFCASASVKNGTVAYCIRVSQSVSECMSESVRPENLVNSESDLINQ